jgi:hypothetical protein
VTARRAGFAVVAALAALVLHAGPAGADPPRPTDYRSTVTGFDPATGVVRAEIVGGDTFLQLTVDDDHEVVVDGYNREPYLRFRADGTVERNRHSPATYLNESRTGQVTLPAEADEEARPDWERVGSGGTYAWHDHRIHWMGAGRPQGLQPGDKVQDWTVSLVVDGTPATITGTLVLAEGVSPLPWVVLGLVAAGLVVLVGRRHPLRAAPAAVFVAAAGAMVAGTAQYRLVPDGAGANPLLMAVPAAGLGLSAVALGLRGRSPAMPVTLAAAAAVIGWAVLRAPVLWKPVLPTDLPYALDRGLTAAALGLALAAAGLVVWGGGLAVATPHPATASTAAGGGTPAA